MSILTTIKRSKVFIQNVRRRPSHQVVKAAQAQGVWALYFAFAPDGRAYDQHRFTIERLRGEGFKVLLVVGAHVRDASSLSGWPPVDALILKAVSGFDFSGYQIGLSHLTGALGTVDVFVMNDSVFGPFRELRPMMDEAPWRLIGFTTSRAVENHVQSYAFFIRQLDAKLLTRLRSVLFQRVCMDRHGAVTYLQETRMARVASLTCAVGTLWAPCDPAVDLPMACAFQLLDDGFPFMKRSILGKFSSDFPKGHTVQRLLGLGHPIRSGLLFDGFTAT